MLSFPLIYSAAGRKTGKTPAFFPVCVFCALFAPDFLVKSFAPFFQKAGRRRYASAEGTPRLRVCNHRRHTPAGRHSRRRYTPIKEYPCRGHISSGIIPAGGTLLPEASRRGHISSGIIHAGGLTPHLRQLYSPRMSFAIASAAVLPAPIARITVAAPVTASPPA